MLVVYCVQDFELFLAITATQIEEHGDYLLAAKAVEVNGLSRKIRELKARKGVPCEDDVFDAVPVVKPQEPESCDSQDA